MENYSNKGTVYRIRIAIHSLPLLRKIVLPHFTPSMLYKLGSVFILFNIMSKAFKYKYIYVKLL